MRPSQSPQNVLQLQLHLKPKLLGRPTLLAVNRPLLFDNGETVLDGLHGPLCVAGGIGKEG